MISKIYCSFKYEKNQTNFILGRNNDEIIYEMYDDRLSWIFLIFSSMKIINSQACFDFLRLVLQALLSYLE